LNHLIKYQVL